MTYYQKIRQLLTQYSQQVPQPAYDEAITHIANQLGMTPEVVIRIILNGKDTHMQKNEPQLSAEMEKRFNEEFGVPKKYKPKLHTQRELLFGDNNSEMAARMTRESMKMAQSDLMIDLYERTKHFLATALEEQKKKYIKMVEDIKYSSPKSCDQTYWYTRGSIIESEAYFEALTDVLALLNGKEE